MKFQKLLRPETVRQEHILALLLVALATICFFWSALVKGNAILAHDIATQFYPARTFFRESIMSGEFPLWCPFPAGGTYYATNSAQQCFYPFIACYLVFPLTYAFTVYTVIHFIIFSFFFYLLARECRISFHGALLCALTPFVAGMPLSEVASPELLAGLAWYPAIILTFIRLLKNTTPLSGTWFALACTMQVLAGSPYPPFYCMVSMAVIAPCYLVATKASFRAVIQKLLYTAGAAIASFLLCAPQLLPMLVIFKSVREYGREGLLPAVFSMRLVDWISNVVPNTLGYEDNFKCFYIGLLPLLIVGLMAYWLVCKKIIKSEHVPVSGQPNLFSVGIIFGILACVGFLLSFGGYIGVDRIIDKIPIISRCNRWPSWIAFLFITGMSILAGIAYDTLIRSRANKSFRMAVLPLLVGGLFIGLGLLIFRNSAAHLVESLRADYWKYLHSNLFMAESYNLSNYPAAGVVLRFALLLIAGCGLLLLATQAKWKSGIIIALFACCLIADKALFYSTREVSHTSKIDIYTEIPSAVKSIKENETKDALFRAYISRNLDHLSIMAASSRRAEDYQFIREHMVGAVGTQYNIATTSILMALREGAYEYVFVPWLESLPPQTKERMLGLWNVKYMFDMGVTADRKLQFSTYINPHYAPRAWISYSMYPMPALRDCLGLMQNNSFNARETVLLVEPKVTSQTLTGTPGTADVQTIKYTSNTVTITATAERDGYLYLSDTYDTGWRAYMDGRHTELHRANMNGRAVFFPAGTHTVVFDYSPAAFWWGLWIGVIAWLALAALLIVEYRRKRENMDMRPQTSPST